MKLESYAVRPGEHRKRLRYIGQSRLVYVWGKAPKPRHARSFAAPVTAIIWSRILQTAAIDRDFFLERDRDDNHTRVIPLTRCTDADIMQQLVAQARAGDGFAILALQFVAQQDQYGYTGAWERTMDKWTPTLQWYKKDKRKQHAINQNVSKRYSAMANKRWANQTQEGIRQ